MTSTEDATLSPKTTTTLVLLPSVPATHSTVWYCSVHGSSDPDFSNRPQVLWFFYCKDLCHATVRSSKEISPRETDPKPMKRKRQDSWQICKTRTNTFESADWEQANPRASNSQAFSNSRFSGVCPVVSFFPRARHRINPLRSSNRKNSGFPPDNCANELDVCVYVYIYIYIHAVKLLSGPSLGFLEVIIWSKLGFLEVIIWSKCVFIAYKNSGFKRYGLHTQLSFCVSFWVPNYRGIF